MCAIDKAVLQERKTELQEDFDELVLAFVDDARASVSEIEAALRGDDVEKLRLVSHSLKSSSAYLGANRVCSLAAEFEAAARSRTISGIEDRAEKLSAEVDAAIEALAGG